MKLKSTLVALSLLVVLVAAMQISASYAHFAETPPTIDGDMVEGEWDGAAIFEKTGYFVVYVFNDFDYLYVGFQAAGGTYLPTGDGTVGIMNVYIWNPAISGQGWAYCWINRDPTNIYLYSYPGRIPTSTAAIFAVTDTVFELRIPLSELGSISLGDTIVLTFLSYSEGLTNWSTCWLYNQIYTLQLPPPIPVYVDIKPGSYPNSINLDSKGVVPVAVLSTVDFDASTVNPNTVHFAGAHPVRWVMEDVDYDGDMDMLFFFKTQDLELVAGSTEATLTGATLIGWPIQGTDTVNIVPK